MKIQHGPATVSAEELARSKPLPGRVGRQDWFRRCASQETDRERFAVPAAEGCLDMIDILWAARFGAAAAFLFACGYPLHAAEITGVVRDPAGVPVSNARVTLTGRTGVLSEQVTDAQGRFRIQADSGSDQRLLVTAEGFATKPVPLSDAAGITLELAAQNDSVLVTGSAIPAPASEQGTSTSLISRQEIRTRNEAQAVDLLRYLPGLVVQQQGQRGALTSVSIRGGDSKYNLVLLDGVPVNTFYYGGLFDFAHIPTDFLDHVEVARGPQSAIYGSYANSGVINFVTRSAETSPTFDFTAEGGSHGERRFGVSGSAMIAGFGFTGSASRLDFEGPVKNSDYENRNVLLGLQRTWKRQSLSLRGNYDANDTGEPGPYGSDPAHHYSGLDRVSRSRNYFSDYLAHYQLELKPQIREEVFASFFLNNSPYQSPYGFSFNKDIRAVAEERTTVSATPWYTTAFGFVAEREELKNTYVVDFGRRKFPFKRDQQGVYWENRFQIGQRFFLNAGVREEIFEQPFIPAEATSQYYATRPDLKGQSYRQTNPKVSAVYALGSTRFHSSFGTGIRPPGGADLAFTDNPALKPERTLSVDVGVEKRLLTDRVSLQATYFYNRYSDQIVGLGGNLSVLGRYRTGNLSRSRAQGAEFAAELRPARWLMLSGNYTYLDSAVLTLNGSDSLVQAFYTLGQPLPRRPKHSGALVSSFQFRRVSANITGYFRGEIVDVEPNYGVSGGFYRNGGFQNIGFNLNYRMDHGLTVYGYLRNALNQRYEELLGYPSPILNFTAGVKWSFPRGRL